MTLRIHAAPKLPEGRVIVIQEGEVVANGWLRDLQYEDDGIDVPTDIYLHPTDAASFAGFVNAKKRRLN